MPEGEPAPKMPVSNTGIQEFAMPVAVSGIFKAPMAEYICSTSLAIPDADSEGLKTYPWELFGS